MNRTQIEQQLISKAQQDPAFRQRLIAQPRETLLQELGVTVPAAVQLQVFEEDANKLMLVLPAPQGELSDLELETVAGGKDETKNNSDPAPASGGWAIPRAPIIQG